MGDIGIMGQKGELIVGDNNIDAMEVGERKWGVGGRT